MLSCHGNSTLIGLQLSATTTITSNGSTAKVLEDTHTPKGSSTPAASAVWRELTLAGGHAGTWHHSHHSYSSLPEGDALSKAGMPGPTFRLRSPETLDADAARTEEMLTSKFPT